MISDELFEATDRIRGMLRDGVAADAYDDLAMETFAALVSMIDAVRSLPGLDVPPLADEHEMARQWAHARDAIRVAAAAVAEPQRTS